MAVKTEQDLSPNAKALYVKANNAVQLKNYGYAISLLQTVLKETPGFLDGRKILRRAEVAATKGKKSFFSGLSTAALKGPGLLKKDPLAAIELAEKTLETDPYSAQGNHLLKDAAMAADLPETAAFALETLVDSNPKDMKALHELGEFFSASGHADRAVEIYTRITDINPADLIANKRGKDAAARATMSSGGWEEVAKSGGTKDYRDLMKDKEKAESLEQKSRVVKSDEMIDQQLNELYPQAEAEPNSLDIARRIALLWEQKGELENAIWWFNRSSEITGHTDNSLSRKVTDLQMEVQDGRFNTLQTELASLSEDDATRLGKEEELAGLKMQKAAMLVNDARTRVEKNPTDLQFRYELGEQLVDAGEFTEAIPELQRARNNPNVRIKAMSLLGRCYWGKGMLDFAVRTLGEAVKELPSMDAVKKEMLYNLGLIYEEMENKDKSIECMKQIYEVDYGYRDVAKRVEGSY